jgi:hypothetical protein
LEHDGMMQRASLRRFLPLLGLASLAACGNTQDVVRTFGLTRDAPDEFRVTTRAPLSMPPDFTLRPPQPGAERPQELSQRDQAQATLVPDSVLAPAAAGAPSPGQQALLQSAGPAAPADIRRRLDADQQRVGNNQSLTDRLMFWKAPTPPGVVVDPTKETERLRANAALGDKPSVGDTPIIQPTKPGFFGSLF